MKLKGVESRYWILAVLLAALPFILRVGIDTDAVQRQAVLTLYRNWRWSVSARALRPGENLQFERQSEASDRSAAALEELFRVQLQQDFRLVEIGSVPRVRAFFAHTGSEIESRVEVQRDGGEWRPWEGSARLVNNGILLGAWAGLVLWLLGRRRSLALGSALVLMLLWQVQWNILDVPTYLLRSFMALGRELVERQHYKDWVASELGRLPELGALLWLVPAVLALQMMSRLFSASKQLYGTALWGFAFEPLALWAASRFGHWGQDTSWWKIYLASFAFRFVVFAHLFLALLRPQTLPQPLRLQRGQDRRDRLSLWLMALLPFVFLFSGGWAWLQAALAPGTGVTLLRLKVFFVGFLLAFTLSSRLFSLWLGTLALAVLFPPTRGHWEAGALYGLLLDGLLLGWWLTPLKGTVPVGLTGREALRFGVVTGLAWLLGVFLSSVGAPLGMSWVTLTLAIWAYAQLAATGVDEPTDGSEAWSDPRSPLSVRG